MRGQPPQIRSGFWLPHRGTKARRLLRLMLRPQGLSMFEAKAMGLCRWNQDLRTTIHRLEFETGFDIRLIGQVRQNDAYGDVYRIAGRHRWNGVYWSLRPADPAPNSRRH